MPLNGEMFTFGQHVCSLLLIDEDDDGRVNAGVEDGDQFVPLLILFTHVDHLDGTHKEL